MTDKKWGGPEMALRVLPVTNNDLDWLVTVDCHVTTRWIQRCIELNEYLIATSQGEAVGFMRHSLFWGAVPFMDMVYVKPVRRRRGIGSLLFRAWEQAMITSGALVLMTSTRLDEPEPQAWHRHNGFESSGELTFGAYQSSSEIFFIKSL